MKIYYVYILKCADGSYYTGITSELEKRISEHILGKFTNCYTFKRRPLELVFTENHIDPYSAINREKQLKKWSHAKKTALIQRDYDTLKILSKSKTQKK